ncbi:methyltransferase domain-containing protein [Streptomyces asoensis]|uniref:methyltransferase domain-containing protein n=1 Tax=Streptomyces asoensis TaxID=249586 RepID=UPI0033CFC37F
MPCELCDEVRWKGTAATGDLGSSSGLQDVFSRLVLRTRAADVLSGLGCLAPGYSLVVPHHHAWSVGELPREERTHVFDTAWQAAELIRRTFGDSVVLVEHGSSGARTGGGSCVTHAHLHLFPLRQGMDPRSFVPPGSRRITTSAVLAGAAARHSNYYYCSWKQDEGHLLIDPKLPSQYARRVWADLFDEPDLWDWAAFPFLGNARLTASALRTAQQPQRFGPVEETVLAYDSAAEFYARRTASFAPGSALPDEIDDLAATVDGIVLDAGAGAGRDAFRFAQRGKHVLALDASLPLLSHSPAHDRTTPILGDVRRLPLPAHCVAAVWCSAVLLHLPSAEFLRSLQEFHRVLRPGGIAQVSVKEGEGHIALPMTGSASPRRHFYFYRVDQLRNLAEKGGFEVLRTWSEDEPDSSSDVQRWIKGLLRKPA